MRLKMRFVLLVVLSVAGILAEESQLLKEFAVGNSKFTADVYREFLKTNPKNFLVCPISAQIVLALVHSGAGGQTAQQLSSGLHLPESKEKIQQTFQELSPHLVGNENYTLSSANKIYVKEGYQIQDEFKNTSVEVFNAEIQNIDFGKNHQAALEINKWVEEKTHDKIKDLINADALNNDTRAVLINAMYFHGKWTVPFNKNLTKKREFYLNHKEQVEVDMMDHLDFFNYHESAKLNATFLELPYAGDAITMTIVLPNDKEGLSALEAQMNDVFVAPQYGNKPLVTVVLPKFKFETTIKFNDILKALGIIDAFRDDAEFREIIVNKSLKISEVIQKTFIEVEEEGTTAAAATSVGLIDIRFDDQPPTQIKSFIADHPFIFYIKIRDVVLFAGRYTSSTD